MFPRWMVDLVMSIHMSTICLKKMRYVLLLLFFGFEMKCLPNDGLIFDEKCGHATIGQRHSFFNLYLTHFLL